MWTAAAAPRHRPAPCHPQFHRHNSCVLPNGKAKGKAKHEPPVVPAKAVAVTRRLDHACATLETLEQSLAGLANNPELQIGRIPERLGRAAVLIEQVRALVTFAIRGHQKVCS